mgnify:CR=1
MREMCAIMKHAPLAMSLWMATCAGAVYHRADPYDCEIATVLLVMAAIWGIYYRVGIYDLK